MPPNNHVSLNQPKATLFLNPVSQFDVFRGYIPIVSAVGAAFIDATLGGIVVTFFVASLSFSKWRKKRISILMVGIITFFAGVIASTPTSLNHFIIDLVVNFLFGVLIAYLYFRFDLLTILAALFYSALTFSYFTLISASHHIIN